MKKPYCEITLFNEGTNTERPVKKSRPVKHSFLIEWNESFEWFNICVEEIMIIKVLGILVMLLVTGSCEFLSISGTRNFLACFKLWASLVAVV